MQKYVEKRTGPAAHETTAFLVFAWEARKHANFSMLPGSCVWVPEGLCANHKEAGRPVLVGIVTHSIAEPLFPEFKAGTWGERRPHQLPRKRSRTKMATTPLPTSSPSGKHFSADPALTQYRKPHPACRDMQLHKKWMAGPGGCWQPARLAAFLEQSEEYRLLPIFFQPSPWTASSLHTLVFASSACDGEGICGWVLSLRSASWHHTEAGPLAGAGSILRATQSPRQIYYRFSVSKSVALLKQWEAPGMVEHSSENSTRRLCLSS